MPKYVKPLSGGLDSATALYWALDKGYEVTSFTLNYGQGSSEQSIGAARKITEKAGVDHTVVPFEGLKGLVNMDSPEGHLYSASPCSQAAPADKLSILVLAATNGISIGCEGTITSVHSGDDYEREYFDQIEDLIERSTGEDWEIRTPFLSMSKGEVIRLGKELGVPLDKTWSCEFPQPGGRRCGTCYLCTCRRRGFKEAEIDDPVDYMSDEILTMERALERDQKRYTEHDRGSPALNA